MSFCSDVHDTNRDHTTLNHTQAPPYTQGPNFLYTQAISLWVKCSVYLRPTIAMTTTMTVSDIGELNTITR